MSSTSPSVATAGPAETFDLEPAAPVAGVSIAALPPAAVQPVRAPAADSAYACSGIEAWTNAAFALSALAAAVMRLADAAPGEWWLPAVIGIAAINGLIAGLFLLRRPVISLGSTMQLVSCLPTMIGFGLAVRLAPELSQWAWYAHGLFAAGAVMTIAAFLALGSSFAVMPALRQTVIRGPYQLVRHPAYAGELLMALACFTAGPSLIALVPWLLLLPGVAWRILAEESVLRSDDVYAEYQTRVRWRLAPGIW